MTSNTPEGGLLAGDAPGERCTGIAERKPRLRSSKVGYLCSDTASDEAGSVVDSGRVEGELQALLVPAMDSKQRTRAPSSVRRDDDTGRVLPRDTR